MSTRIFRWKAIGPLLGFLLLLGILWLLFAETLARRSLEYIGTRIIGAKVEIGSLDLGAGSATLRRLVVASPHEPFRNLFEADELAAEVALLPLLEKKVVIERLAANGMRFGTRRESDGRVQLEGGRGGLVDPRTWSELFDFPALDLVTGEVSVGDLDANDLYTVQEARALTARADSTRTAWEANIAQVEDSVTAAVEAVDSMLQRLSGARLTDLGLLNDARRTVEQVDASIDRITGLEGQLTATFDSLEARVAGLQAAKQRDYERARRLVQLPSLDATAIAAALFGPVAVDRFQRAVYWSVLARRYMPPGLQPRARPGPKRLRRSGVTAQFPRQGEYPGFLLGTAEASFSLGGDDAVGAGQGGEVVEAADTYAGRLSGLTSAPALYGRPTQLDVQAPGIVAGGLFDHTGDVPRDSLGATLSGLRLDTLGLGGLPIRLAPGDLTARLSFALEGEELRARWSVNADRVEWIRDGTAGGQVEDLVWRVVSGISDLEITAQLTGSLTRPSLSVRSNLDRAVADRLRAVAGDEIAAAEARLRAEVDRLVGDEISAAESRATALRAQLEPLLAAQDQRLREAQRQLEERLRQLTGGLRLPG